MNGKPLKLLVTRFLLPIAGVAVACEIGLVMRNLGLQTMTPMWPAAGVSFAIFCLMGSRGWLPVIIGYCWIWLRLNPAENPIVWFLPPLYAAEAWFARKLRKAGNLRIWGQGRVTRMTSWDSLVAPAASCLLITGLVAILLTTLPDTADSGHLTEFFHYWLLVFVSHLHGVVAVGPLIFYALKSDFRKDFFILNITTSFASLATITLAVLAVGPWGNQSPFENIILLFPLPFLILAGFASSEAQASALAAIWCFLTTSLTFFPGSIFSPLPGIASTNAELAVYNIIACGLSYGAALVGSNFARFRESHKFAMGLVNMHPWEWTPQNGFLHAPAIGGPWNFRPDITWLAGDRSHDLVNSSENEWRVRVSVPDKLTRSGDFHFDSTGRVISRSLSGAPEHIVGLIRDITEEERSREKLIDSDHQKARLKSLQANLNRHFLFNSLNMVKALVHIDSEKADLAVSSLADLMRNCLRNTEESMIPFWEELIQIKLLLRLAKLRFEERLDTQIDVPKEYHQVPVPPMLLLNLVENALTHGIERLENGGQVVVSARPTDGNRLFICVTNPGTFSDNSVTGMGINDANERLNNIYKGNSSFHLSQSSPNTVSAVVIIPLPHEISYC